jgi:hypothetical protein
MTFQYDKFYYYFHPPTTLFITLITFSLYSKPNFVNNYDVGLELLIV